MCLARTVCDHIEEDDERERPLEFDDEHNQRNGDIGKDRHRVEQQKL
jgi:hypothetical protein